MKTLNLFIKRIADILISGIGLIVVSPILLISIIAIKITMPGPIFFHQERAGKLMKPFDILKLRTMKVDAEAEKKLDINKDAERITPVGKILRRTKIDELPQLLNVLKGDMSLVGPRPTVMAQAREYDEFQKLRLLMRPGMTGLAQINGNISLSWDERIQYDVKYVNEFNIGLDIIILLKTVKVVIFGEDKYRKPLNS